mmetsp:Transcript_17116/g.28660  ORF Transcript_17116/g.28660 Transcript_17116/m.28660 type:complete len:305 (-) Transcript_17116:281-1195(-)
MICFVLVALVLGVVNSADDRVIALEAMVKAMQKQMQEQTATIAALTADLEAKATDHKQHVQLTTGGEVVELVSTATVKALEKRVEACELKNDDQDATIGMTAAIVHTIRGEHKDTRSGAPPPLPPSPPQPLPPPRPIPKPGRQLSSLSNGNFVNELSITGPNAVVSWNSHTPGLTPFNCTGVGDGQLTCSGTIQASNVVIAGTSTTLVDLIREVATLWQDVASMRQFVGLRPPQLPPSSPPPAAELSPSFGCCPAANGVVNPTGECLVATNLACCGCNGYCACSVTCPNGYHVSADKRRCLLNG